MTKRNTTILNAYERKLLAESIRSEQLSRRVRGVFLSAAVVVHRVEQFEGLPLTPENADPGRALHLSAKAS